MRDVKAPKESKGSFNYRANMLASEYWKCKEKIGLTGEEMKRLEEIEKLLAKGISGALGLQLEKEANRLRRMMDEKRTASATLAAIKRDLLELTADFAPSLSTFHDGMFSYDAEQPLSEEYFRALTDVLFGQPSSELRFKNAVYSPEGIKVMDAKDEFSALQTLNFITMLIQESAKELLGRENVLRRAWRRMRESDYAMAAFDALLKVDAPLSVDEIAKLCKEGDEEYHKLVRQAYERGLTYDLEYLSSDAWEYPPIRKVGEKYELTDFGRWVYLICRGKREETRAPRGRGLIGRIFSK